MAKHAAFKLLNNRSQLRLGGNAKKLDKLIYSESSVRKSTLINKPSLPTYFCSNRLQSSLE